MSQEDLLSPDRAAAYLTENGFTVKPATLAEWRSTGRYALPYVKLGKIVRYRVTALDAFLASKGLSKELIAAVNDGARIIGDAECERLTSLSRSTRTRAMAAGKFPQCFILSGTRRIGWRLADVEAWLAGLPVKAVKHE